MRLVVPNGTTHGSSHNRTNHEKREERKEELAASSAPERDSALRVMRVLLLLTDGAILLSPYTRIVCLARNRRERWASTSWWGRWYTRGRCR